MSAKEDDDIHFLGKTKAPPIIEPIIVLPVDAEDQKSDTSYSCDSDDAISIHSNLSQMESSKEDRNVLSSSVSITDGAETHEKPEEMENGSEQKTEIGVDKSVQPVNDANNVNIVEDTPESIDGNPAKKEVANPFFNCERNVDNSRVLEPNSDYSTFDQSGNYADVESSFNLDSTLTATFIPSIQEGETTIDGDSANTTEGGKFYYRNNLQKSTWSHTFLLHKL